MKRICVYTIIKVTVLGVIIHICITRFENSSGFIGYTKLYNMYRCGSGSVETCLDYCLYLKYKVFQMKLKTKLNETVLL